MSDCNLKTLEHSPRYIPGEFDCSDNKNLSLKGAPDKVDGIFACENCNLTSLEFAPPHTGTFLCGGNKIKSLSMIHKRIKSINGEFGAYNNKKLESNLLGLLLIDGITRISLDNIYIAAIMNKYLGRPNKKIAMLTCQQELIDAGFEEAAQF